MTKTMLTRAEIDAYEGILKSHFLNDNAIRRNKSLGDLTGLSAIGFHIIEVQPGHESTELHKHYYEEECVYVLEGEAEAVIGEDAVMVYPGDCIAYPAGGAAHQLRNTGSSILKCIVVGQRLPHDIADYPRRGKRVYRNANMNWNLVDIEDIEEPVAGRKV